MSSKIKVVFLDAGGTLFRPYPSVGHVYARIAQKHGVVLEPVHIDQRFHQAWHTRNGLASLTALSNEKIERDWWHAVVSEVFSKDAAFSDFEAFFAELYDHFATAECWRVFDDTQPLLDALRQAGVRMGIISNWDHRLFSIVEQLGLTAYFEAIFASSAVGVAKPGEGIFRKALQTFKIQPNEAIHVGDSVEEDYYGALRVGLKAVLIDRHRKPYNGVVKIESLHELIPLLNDQHAHRAQP